MWIFLFLSAFLLACNFCQRQPGCRVFHSFFGRGGARRRVETDGGWKGDSILRLFRFFLHPGSHRIKQLFFPNFLTTNERAVDAVVYPWPCTKAARNLCVAHLPRFFPPSTYDSARRKSTIPEETSTLYLSTAKPTLRFFSARVGRIEKGYDKVEILGL